MVALDAARSAGAQYADVRISRNRVQSINTRERRVQGLSDNETFGFGVRTLVGGAWGFAASSDLTRDEVARIARQAAAQAQANRATLVRPVALAAAPGNVTGTWQSPHRIDPFDVAIEDKVALLLSANEAALKVQGSRFVNSSMFFLREEKTCANTDGSFTVQTIYRASPNMTVAAVSSDFSDFQSRQSTDIAPMGRGYEHVIDSKLVENAPRWAEEAVQKLSAKPVDVGRYDLVLHPTHLGLTIHESIAHPTELDRVYGYEANYAGTSFVAPPEQMLGKFRYGPEFMNIQGDRMQDGSLGAVGWDDEGVQPETFLIIKNGVVNDYQTTREHANWLDFGPDYYAVRTYRDYDNAENRTITLGWMGNWEYANAVPTSWGKGALALPRELELRSYPGGLRLMQRPIPAFEQLRQHGAELGKFELSWRHPLQEFVPARNTYEIDVTFTLTDPDATFGLRLAQGGEHDVTVGYDARTSSVFLDRTHPENAGFSGKFRKYATAPLEPQDGTVQLHIFVDQSSVEVFANDGERTLTALMFPDPGSTSIELFSENGSTVVNNLRAWELRSIWDAQ